jgi:hypothetical protein
VATSKGINGTFAPAYIDEDIEYAAIRKIVKKVEKNGVWEDRVFIMLTDGTNRTQVSDWLKEHYGPSIYSETWWSTFSSVCMSDKIYTHWKLLQ